jgi:hypothetical protein
LNKCNSEKYIRQALTSTLPFKKNRLADIVKPIIQIKSPVSACKKEVCAVLHDMMLIIESRCSLV